MLKFGPLALIVVLTAAMLTISDGARLPSAQAALLSASIEPGENIGAVAERVHAAGFDVVRQFPDIRALEVNVPESQQAGAIARLQNVAGVRFAEPVHAVRSTDVPSDPLYGKESAYLQILGAPNAWNITKGQPSIVVAVVDSGIDVQHTDLRANMWTNPGEVASNGRDDDANGCIDDVNGCSFVTESSPGCAPAPNGDVNDDIGHGTFVAGVIAAAANGTGMVGVARNVRLMGVKVLDCFGAGDTLATARGINYAVHNGARVINLSLGGLEESQLLTDTIDSAVANGVVVVAAAGNDGSKQIAYPARLPNVIAVGATKADGGSRAVFSDWGPAISVVAAGENVVGTVPKSECELLFHCLTSGPWALASGTSFAAPQISGLAALMLSVNPGLSSAQVKSTIENSATALPAANQPEWAGNGRANMVAALQSVQGNHPPGDTCTVASVIDGSTFTCVGGRTVRMLAMSAPALGECGGDWAKAALQYIFLTPGRTVYLRYDFARTGSGATLAAPLWRSSDGNDYNLSIVMVYVGLARATNIGPGNFLYQDWASAAEQWSSAAQWNMWSTGKPFRGGC